LEAHAGGGGRGGRGGEEREGRVCWYSLLFLCDGTVHLWRLNEMGEGVVGDGYYYFYLLTIKQTLA
jgi:hypothetical protein